MAMTRRRSTLWTSRAGGGAPPPLGRPPTPAIGSLAVSFSLDGHDPATLDLVDLTGRRWLARHVGSLGPGRHTLMVDRLPTLPAGIYWVRLTQGPKFAALKVCIVR